MAAPALGGLVLEPPGGQQAALDCSDGAGLHHLVAGRTGDIVLLDMERTHGLLAADAAG
jgi:hypothetical protein